MRIRPTRADEVSLFAGYAGDAEQTQLVHTYVEQMIDAGTMRPEWCFVAADGHAQPSGRIAFFTLPAFEQPLDIVLFDADWHEHGQPTARQLIEQALHDARRLGATTLGYALDDPPANPHYHYHLQERLALLHQLGFRLARETLRFESPLESPSMPEPRLRYRSISDVSEEAFVDAIALISENSLDQRIEAGRVRIGIGEQARETLDELQHMEYEPEWWQLAFTPAGDLVGLLMPASNYVFGVIGFIGVGPAQRGNGYIHELLAQSTSILHDAGYRSLRADTDISNAPMASAFQRAGWRHFATRRELSVTL